MTLFVERRRPAFSAELLVRVALAWAMISALLLVTNMSAMFAHRFPDPDDTLRLIEVRDLLAGQGWFDLTQHRVDAVHGGVPMHWSRLVDMPIAAVIILLRGLIGQGAAEMAALIVVPLLTFACALLLTGRIAWRLIGEEAAGFACLAMALSVPLVQQLRPMRIDHHGWQIVCLLVAVNGLMARSPRWGGWITGVALATWLAISIEGLPLTAALCGVAALRWLRDRHDAQWFVATMQGLALGSVALFLATRGLRAVGEHCDAISPAHLAGFGVAALAATGLSRLEPLPRGAFVLGLGLIAGAGIAVLLSLAPQCAGGAFLVRGCRRGPAGVEATPRRRAAEHRSARDRAGGVSAPSRPQRRMAAEMVAGICDHPLRRAGDCRVCRPGRRGSRCARGGSARLANA
jgi:hypothetical protein